MLLCSSVGLPACPRIARKSHTSLLPHEYGRLGLYRTSATRTYLSFCRSLHAIHLSTVDFMTESFFV